MQKILKEIVVMRMPRSLSLQLFLLISAFGCCSSSSVAVKVPSPTKKLDMEQHESVSIVQSRREDAADNIFIIGQSRKGGCKKFNCKQKCKPRSSPKCGKRAKLKKKCCDKDCICGSSNPRSCMPHEAYNKTEEAYKRLVMCGGPGSTSIPNIDRDKEKKRLRRQRKEFRDHHTGNYGFELKSGNGGWKKIYVIDGDLVLTETESLDLNCSNDVCEGDTTMLTCAIHTIEDMFDIIEIGIRNHPATEIDLYKNIVLHSVQYDALKGWPTLLKFSPIGDLCNPRVFRVRNVDDMWSTWKRP